MLLAPSPAAGVFPRPVLASMDAFDVFPSAPKAFFRGGDKTGNGDR